jgi:hypothetical protein
MLFAVDHHAAEACCFGRLVGRPFGVEFITLDFGLNPWWDNVFTGCAC